MDKSSWAKVEEILRGYFSSVRLKIGDDIITLQLRRAKMKLVIAVYVNGTIDLSKEEYQKKYWKEATVHLLSPSAKKRYAAEMIKIWGKRKGTAKLADDEFYNGKSTYHFPYFSSITELKRQYNKRFEKIELLDELSCEGM